MRMESSLARLAVLVSASLLHAAGWTGPAAAQNVILKLSNDSPPVNAKVKGLIKWAEFARNKSGGRLEIRVFHSGQLYDDIKAIPAVSAGSVDIALPPTSLLTSVVQDAILFELPSVWGTTYDEYRRLVTGEVGRKLFEKLETKLNVKVLGYYFAGQMVWASTKREIKQPSDFSGQRIRFVGGALTSNVLRSFGAALVQVVWPGVPTALQQGVMDGLETSMSGFVSINGWQLIKYMTFAKHKLVPYVFLMNRDAWKRLPADLQKILMDTFDESQVWQDT